MTILLLSDIIDRRLRKQKELAFYAEQKAALEVKLAQVRHEINLTDKILSLIRKEELLEIGRHVRST
jgi:hypothetical protein